ncbi:hypothetical protein CCP3SC15_6090002 [Gammaproteobacteria bacterium]
MFETKYLFKPRSPARGTVPRINPAALDREEVEIGDQAGTLRLDAGQRMTSARDQGGSMILAWLDDAKVNLVLVEKADLKEVVSWA